MEKILLVTANINKALEIAQSKGAFTLEQASSIYNNLLYLSKYLENSMKSEQTIQNISHMTPEESADSEAQEYKGVILNEKEQKEIDKRNAIEDLIRQAVESSSEDECDEIAEERPIEEIEETRHFEEECKIEEEVVEEEVVEEEVVEEEVVEEKAVEEKAVEEEVVDVSVVTNNSPNDNHTVSNLENKKIIDIFSKKEIEKRRQLQKPLYSDDESSDDDETITI